LVRFFFFFLPLFFYSNTSISTFQVNTMKNEAGSKQRNVSLKGWSHKNKQ